MQGLPAAPGLAKGPALRWEQQPLAIPAYAPTDLTAERVRLNHARRTAAEQLRQLSSRIGGGLGDAEAALFEAQAMFAEDANLLQRLKKELIKAKTPKPLGMRLANFSPLNSRVCLMRRCAHVVQISAISIGE